MSGIFPNSADGALPPNPSDPNNPAAAFSPVTPPLNTAALYYGNGCDARIRPEVINSIISEIEATVDQANTAYDLSSRKNLEQSIRYLIQRGLQTGNYLYGGPFDYTMSLDPPITGYNDFMTLVVVPTVSNQGAVRINLNGRGLVPVLRNDVTQMQSGDFHAYVPAIITYWEGNWYHIGLCTSQVPIVTGSVDIWIRTDGNDVTGDGSANTPDRAFLTIQGAWNKVGGRYAATPLFTMNLRLGIPGTYVGGDLGPFGGAVHLWGDPNNRSQYRIQSVDTGNNNWASLALSGMTHFVAHGITFVRDKPPPYGSFCVWVSSSTVYIDDCDFDSTVANGDSDFIHMNGGEVWFVDTGSYNFFGRNLAIGCIFYAILNASMIVGGVGAGFPKPAYAFYDCPIGASALEVGSLSTISWNWSQVGISNCTGVQYSVVENSILNMHGYPLIGTVAGGVSSGGQFIP